MISYYDEEIGISVPICNRPECPRNDDTCTAYAKGLPYLLLDEQNQNQPLYLYCSDMENENDIYPKTKIFSMDADGSQRTLRIK